MTVWMIVEDDNTTIQLFTALTGMRGHESIGFRDGQATLDWIDAVDQGQIAPPLPTIALLDIRLPRITGIAIAERLRQSPVLGDIAIVFMTAGYVSEEEKQAILMKTGANLLLRKPLPNLAQLLHMLNIPKNEL
jgi:CheY-like chemotaxis protein